MKTLILCLLLTLTSFSNVNVDNRPAAATKYVATAYCLKGRMANGKKVHSGAIAADPRVLPLGSKVHIQDMGVFTVGDTGGAIKGRKIDIWMNNCQAARKFGRKTVYVRRMS